MVCSLTYQVICSKETFSQLMVNGSLLHSTVTVHDKPNYHHRGLMIDTGRRFFPMSLVYNLLDAMSYLKMNVLHFHLSDYCRFAVESVKFPQLTASLNGQYYKQDDIRAILEYARERGIRVVPEFDLPGHSKGLAPLAEDGYLNFCSDNHREIYGDPQNKSLETLQTLLAEMATLFPESLFDIGCDETAEVGLCTITNIKTLEQQLFDFIYSRLGKVPTAYEEALFKSKSAKSNVVIQAWESYRAFEVVRQGNKAIEGNGGHFYLSHSTVPLSAVWTDIAYNMTAAGKKLLLGGEISFWTDEYCPNFQCWNETNSHHRNMPVASWMWDSAHDSIFSQSVGNMIWPRGIAAAGAFWNFNSSLSTSSMDFLTRYHAQNQRLIERGVISCPSNCTCDTLSKCGKLYPHAVLVNDTK
ncbi:beta-hexosaminidase subunit alpha-like isoform X2 [Corticium candelabrum]|uniref:beta-hexosaminidase subunit alpha-like isoform X2 n=1 Tax=Corticium candelabrum TaxID=121492 RepID=UPI002E2743B9|nr:beta-hexosaminidase subunit alpha-like isoform X2 [Corticium candelabrum]